MQCTKLLDAGCGAGFLTCVIADRFPDKKITAIDIDKDYIEYAKQKNNRKNIEYRTDNIFKLKELMNYDVVLCLEVLEHLQEYRKALRILAGLTKKYIIVSVPNEPYFRMANIMRLKYLSQLGNTPDHVNNWTKKELIALLSEYGSLKQIKSSSVWNISVVEV